MLSYLRISNLAVAKDIKLELAPGLIVVTGETGAGKSVLLKSLQLLTGERASSEFIREGEEKCFVEAIFELSPSDYKQILNTLNNSEIDPYPSKAKEIETRELIVRRELTKKGKSRAFINSELVTLATLKKTVGELIEFTSQHDQVRVTDGRIQLKMLDSTIVDGSIFEKVQSQFKTVADIASEIESLKEQQSRSEEERRYLEFDLETLEKLNLKENELTEIEQQLNLQSQSEVVGKICGRATELISEENGLSYLLKSLRSDLSEDLEFFATENDLLSEAAILLEEAERGLRAKSRSADFNPHQLEKMRARLSEIKRMERRFAKDSNELFVYYRGLKNRLSKLENSQALIDELELGLKKAEDDYDKLAVKLSNLRKKSSSSLAKSVTKKLPKLGLAKATFEIKIGKGKRSSRGSDSISFLFSANPGMSIQPLDKTASGGELSRLLLAIKASIGGDSNHETRQGAVSSRAGNSGAVSFGTMIFDEIDAGVGGGTAQEIGKLLLNLGQKSQTVVITHSPQVAAFSSTHYQVEKHFENGSTYSQLRELSSEEKLEEIARMLAGKEVTSQFVESASALLREAGNSVPSISI